MPSRILACLGYSAKKAKLLEHSGSEPHHLQWGLGRPSSSAAKKTYGDTYAVECLERNARARHQIVKLECWLRPRQAARTPYSVCERLTQEGIKHIPAEPVWDVLASTSLSLSSGVGQGLQLRLHRRHPRANFRLCFNADGDARRCRLGDGALEACVSERPQTDGQSCKVSRKRMLIRLAANASNGPEFAQCIARATANWEGVASLGVRLEMGRLERTVNGRLDGNISRMVARCGPNVCLRALVLSETADERLLQKDVCHA